MRTSFKSKPGFFCVTTAAYDKTLKPNEIRINTITFESYVLHESKQHDMDTEFTVLAALSESSAQHKELLLALHKHLSDNLDSIRSA